MQRSIYAAIIRHLRDLGEVHEDAVQVGVFLKTDRKLAELRPKSKWLSLDLLLSRRVDHSRVSRHIPVSPRRTVHVIRLASLEDVDDWVRNLLTQAYFDATDER